MPMRRSKEASASLAPSRESGSRSSRLAPPPAGATCSHRSSPSIAARIKDGPALEKQVKNRFGKEGSLPPEAKVAFDTGKAAGAKQLVRPVAEFKFMLGRARIAARKVPAGGEQRIAGPLAHRQL